MYVAVMMALVWATWELVGADVRPVVIFTPEWNKIFAGEPIIMTCYVKSTRKVDETYLWYKEGEWVHTGKSYTIPEAQSSHSGRYQCQTSISDKSDSVSLDVQNGYVILQAPLYIFEGDNIILRCSHHPGFAAKQTIFFKENDVIQDWGPESELFIENIFIKSVWRYRCKKQVYHNLIYYKHTDLVSFSVTGK
ncbi:low affinity immunoglobulin gamma Fc region receptor III-A-like [Pyxicephalus adspersus]